MKEIYVAQNRMDADLACEELRNRGFDAVVIGDLAAIPSSPFPSVWVPDDEARAAAEAWKELQGLSATNNPGASPS